MNYKHKFVRTMIGLSLTIGTGLTGSLTLTGCGGGSSVDATRATYKVTINWTSPLGKASRLLPLSAQLVNVHLIRVATPSGANSKFVGAPRQSGALSRDAVPSEWGFVRPANSTSSVISIQAHPGQYQVTYTAYLNQGAYGTIVAVGSGNITLTAGETVSATIDQSSTVDTLELITYSSTLTTGRTMPVYVAPKTAAGQIVLVDPSHLQWVSSAPAFATVDANGIVTAVAPGTTTITVTDADSGKLATRVFTVSNNTIP